MRGSEAASATNRHARAGGPRVDAERTTEYKLPVFALAERGSGEQHVVPAKAATESTIRLLLDNLTVVGHTNRLTRTTRSVMNTSSTMTASTSIETFM